MESYATGRIGREVVVAYSCVVQGTTLCRFQLQQWLPLLLCSSITHQRMRSAAFRIDCETHYANPHHFHEQKRCNGKIGTKMEHVECAVGGKANDVGVSDIDALFIKKQPCQ
jgi:hypothetical protein